MSRDGRGWFTRAVLELVVYLFDGPYNLGIWVLVEAGLLSLGTALLNSERPAILGWLVYAFAVALPVTVALMSYGVPWSKENRARVAKPSGTGRHAGRG